MTNTETATPRGFAYDKLTEADDHSIEATRHRIYACPCGPAAWLSIQTGEVYRGNGGNEREQWWLQAQGPWVQIDSDPIGARAIAERDTVIADRDATLAAIRGIVGEAD